MKWLFILLTIWIPIARGEEVQVGDTSFEHFEDQRLQILLPNNFTVTLSRQAANPAPDCSALLQKLESDRQSIELCTEPNDNQAFCTLVQGDIRRFLLGIRNEGMGSFTPDATQSWKMQWSLPITSLNLDQAAQAVASPRDGIILGGLSGATLSNVNVVVHPSSWSAKIERFRGVNVHPTVRVSNLPNGMLELTTNNRLMACEILSGKISFRTTLVGFYQFQTPADLAQVDDYWQLYQNLKSMGARLVSRKDQLITTGFMFGQYLKEKNAELTEEQMAPLSRFFLPGANVDEPLTEFRNVYHLARTLPQRDNTKSYQWGIDVRVGTP